MASPLNSPGASAPTLLGVGHVALDLIFAVDSLALLPVKHRARSHVQVVGGMTASACTAAARLGAVVRFASPVGDDDAAEAFQRHFRREGVDASWLRRVAGATSTVSAILVDPKGERAIVSRLGSALADPPPFDLDSIEGCDLLLADPRCPAWAEAAMRAMRDAGRPSVFDGDTAPRADLHRLAGLARWAVFSSQGLRAWLGVPADDALTEDWVSRGLAELLEAGAEVAVVTQGEQGLHWLRRGASIQAMPAFRVGSVIDTLGAGDVFHGALGVALARGDEDEAALRFASVAAALKCTGAGGIAAAPRAADVAAALRASAGTV